MNSSATEIELWSRADWRALEGIVPFRRVRGVLERLEVGVLRALDPRTDLSSPESEVAHAFVEELRNLLDELQQARPALDAAVDAVVAAVGSPRVEVDRSQSVEEPVQRGLSFVAEESTSTPSATVEVAPRMFVDECSGFEAEQTAEAASCGPTTLAGGAAPVTSDDLERFRAGFSARSSLALVADPHPLARSRATMRALIDAIGDAPDLSSEVAIIEELERIDELTQPSEQHRWREVEPSLLGAWLGLLVARLRALREHIVPGSERHLRHKDVINRLPTFRAEYGGRLPFVHGMQRDQGPRSGSWIEDATRCLEQLRAELKDDPPCEPNVRSTRRRSPGQASALQVPTDANAQPSSTLRVLFFGGTPRPKTTVAVRRQLGLSAFEWHRNDAPRKLESLAEAIRSGRYDVVLHNRFLQHKESEALQRAAAAASVPVIRVRTCGVDNIARALAELATQTPVGS